MPAHITDDCEGMRVVHGGETVGRVFRVDDDVAYIDFDPDPFETLLEESGWGEVRGRGGVVSSELVEEITDEELRLRPAQR